MLTYEEIILELARFEREAMERIRLKVASRQLGELWKGLESETPSDDRRAA
jgi:hypothetical protein